ncbi:MAG: bifunctional [glutamine synthetase] adenylyltransferase/[glutamine synthetase]-adenylyl-L-tyrosine phosphorylase [Alphaproteobacteria bacterium]|nr:MAG: bifunctional [glutamine synthetase] adenylyltransferase/[glutamine synthetase]-adenylyl-L-tyrosine phosphorylase [Alphaproteobacteria bacterium]
MQDIKRIEKIPFTEAMHDLPPAGDEELLRIGLEEWERLNVEEEDYASFAAEFGKSEKGARLLAAIFGNSPFLSACLLNERPLFRLLVEDGAEAALRSIHDDLDTAVMEFGRDRVALMAALRIAKRRIALLTALCDIGHVWPLMRVTGVLSDFADRAVDICAGYLLAFAAEKGELVLPHPENPVLSSGLVILGMGKLGARELNYSSDIDLVILFDAEKVTYTGRRSMADCFVRIARNLVTMMQERTRDGYVFRTDLRLRPDPGATPIALSLGAAHVYYESQGQNWERAAMIKARPIAGDLAAGRDFVTFLTPFVWRKSMDFAAIEDIQAIKSQIHTHKGFSRISLEGHNIKIGRGGIREIEFFCQTQQLIEGGRNPALRDPTTLGTLDELAECGKVKKETAAELARAYHFLRTLEHRLQMLQDEQTQLLPDDAREFEKLGAFFGLPDATEFKKNLLATLECVQKHYDALFEFEKTPDRKAGRLVFTGAENDPDTLASLAELGFTDTAGMSQKIREWHHGRYRSTRTERAQQILTALMPHLLEELADTSDPDAAFTRFDAFLQKLPAGVQLFSLFKAHPSLLNLMAKIMGMAPELASTLAQSPMLLDGVLDREFMAPLAPKESLAEDLKLMLSTARDFQDILDFSRRWTNDMKFRLGVQILDNVDHGSGKGATVTAGPVLSDIAEVVLNSLFPKVLEELSERHGRVPGAEFAVLAMGKLGSREMSPGSDADLIFVFDTPEDNMMTDGTKPIPAGLFFTRLSQRFINSLSALTADGQLYEVDMRLRPHGKSGPIALPLDGFVRYYQEEAWTWEHLALTRARVVAGDPGLMARAHDALQTINGTRRDPEKLRKDTRSMRRRIHAQHTARIPWTLKHVPGGMMDLEFICQYLRLLHGPDHPEVLRPNSPESLVVMQDLGLITAEMSARLIEISALYLNVNGLQHLCLGPRKMDENAPAALKAALARAGHAPDFEALEAKLYAAEDYVTRLFDEILPAPEDDMETDAPLPQEDED